MAWTCGYPDPHGTTDLPSAYCVIAESNLAQHSRQGRITVNVFQSKRSYDAGKPLVAQESFQPGANGFPSWDELFARPVDASCVPGTTPFGECYQLWLEPVVMAQPVFKNAVPA
jgi:hypothetical protein